MYRALNIIIKYFNSFQMIPVHQLLVTTAEPVLLMIILSLSVNVLQHIKEINVKKVTIKIVKYATIFYLFYLIFYIIDIA